MYRNRSSVQGSLGVSWNLQGGLDIFYHPILLEQIHRVICSTGVFSSLERRLYFHALEVFSPTLTEHSPLPFFLPESPAFLASSSTRAPRGPFALETASQRTYYTPHNTAQTTDHRPQTTDHKPQTRGQRPPSPSTFDASTLSIPRILRANSTRLASLPPPRSLLALFSIQKSLRLHSPSRRSSFPASPDHH